MRVMLVRDEIKSLLQDIKGRTASFLEEVPNQKVSWIKQCLLTKKTSAGSKGTLSVAMNVPRQ